MHIGFDANEIIHGERAIRRYAVNLLRALPEFTGNATLKALYFCFRPSPKKPLQFSGRLLSKVRNCIIPLPYKTVNLISVKTGFPQPHHFMGKLDLFHSPGLTRLAKGPYPTVVTIHSMAHKRIPEHLDPAYLKWYESFLEWTVHHADYFITVSESMRSDFISHYGVTSDKVKAIPLGVGSEFQPGDRLISQRLVRERFGITDPYILYVGGIQKNKNVLTLVEAFSRLKSLEKSPVKLVLAGDENYGADEIKQRIARCGIQDEVILTGYLDQESADLTLLYQGAKLFWFMSFWEGWASPPLEALRCGIPVLVSDIPPLRESLGDAAVYCGVDQPEVLAEQTCRLLNEEDAYADLSENGIRYAQQFSWQATADRTMQYYREIIATL